MLVRAKRLAFRPSGDGMQKSAEAVGRTYVIRPAYGGGWEWFVCTKTDSVLVDTRADAIAACQADFDARMLSMIEVPELVWTLDDFNELQSTCGNYRVWNGAFPADWHAEYNGHPYWSVLVNSAAGAKSAANTHNRAAILGTTAATEPLKESTCKPEQ